MSSDVADRVEHSEAGLPTAAIAFEGVVKAFGSRKVLNGQDFTVRKGELFVIIGPSGTGKSVTLKLMAGLLRPTAGIVRVLGQDVAALPADRLSALRRRMGFS